MNKGHLYVISGPSGSGKTTLYKRLLKDHKNFARSTSYTTRPIRPGEAHGKDYFFISEKMFKYKREKGHFLEWENVFGNYYGTSAKQVCDLIKTGKSVIFCIDIKGAKSIKRIFPEAITIFVKTKSLNVLRSRLKARGSESDAIIERRLERVKKELREESFYDFVLVNDDLDQTYNQLVKFVGQSLKD